MVDRPARFLALTLLLTGCASAAATRCLRLPVSSKLPEVEVQGCVRALAADPERIDLFAHTVALLRERGDLGAVERHSRDVLGRDPERSDAQFALAFSLRQQGRYEEALAAYQAYTRLNPQDPDPYFGIALCHEGRGAAAAAINAYEAYLGRERRPARQGWRRRAQTRRDALSAVAGVAPPRRQAGAVAPIPSPPKQAVAPIPSPPTTPPPAARKPPRVTQPGAGRRPPVAPAPRVAQPRARDCNGLQRAIAADPFATESYERFARCAREGGKHHEIVRHMRIALRDNPDWARGWLHLGRAQQALGQTAQASASLAKACAAGVSEAC